jgi:peroxiredoxin Q/BCP
MRRPVQSREYRGDTGLAFGEFCPMLSPSEWMVTFIKFLGREILEMIEPGKKAPDFCLASTRKQKICLGDDPGKWVVLFFYVKDNTSG